MMKPILLSIVIPVYNQASLLQRCLHSLRDADVAERLQVVIVDDGSSDEQQTRLLSLSRIDGLNACVIRTSHQGASEARNRGIDAAHGDYVWFVDADDSVDPVAFRQMFSILENMTDSADLIHTGAMQSDSNKKGDMTRNNVVLKKVDCAMLLVPRTACLDHTTYIVNRNLFVRHPSLRYPVGRQLLEDSVFVLLLLECAETIYEAEECHPYVRHRESGSHTAGAWNEERCDLLVPDIDFFFDNLTDFLRSHPDYPRLESLFNRYCYLYLRVLSVKGCPWRLLSAFRDRQSGRGYSPATIKEKILFNRHFLRLLSDICHTFRAIR